MSRLKFAICGSLLFLQMCVLFENKSLMSLSSFPEHVPSSLHEMCSMEIKIVYLVQALSCHVSSLSPPFSASSCFIMSRYTLAFIFFGMMSENKTFQDKLYVYICDYINFLRIRYKFVNKKAKEGATNVITFKISKILNFRNSITNLTTWDMPRIC